MKAGIHGSRWIPAFEDVAKGQITPLTVILAKAGIHFSQHIPCFEGVAKALKPRLFPLSVIRAKEGIDCKVDPCLREDDGQGVLRPLATVSIAGMTMVYSKLPIPNFMRSLTGSAQTRLND